MNVIAIFDAGRTNKKLFLFDEQYKIVWERSYTFAETKDEDGEACEDLEKLTHWITEALDELKAIGDIRIRAINFSAYGASLVHIGEGGTPVTPLYNYLKPYPEELKQRLYFKYGGEAAFSMLTASPVLGSLNSGMQLYRLKEEQPELFARIRTSLHLPQYLSWLLTKVACSDITSIGCHTHLWNFSSDRYHEWVYEEGIIDKLAPLHPSTDVLPVKAFPGWFAGIGLHDSSAAMIPYLDSFREPFVLISTGTWCISMNPFNSTPLTATELQQDCLCYMSYEGRPVKASRLFAGRIHEERVKRLAGHFDKSMDYYTTVRFDPHLVLFLRSDEGCMRKELNDFSSYEQGYHRLLMDIMEQQVASTGLVLEGTATKKIFVDGGFGRNEVYMHLLAGAFPGIGVFAASIPQASAIGAALAIHGHWNSGPPPGDLIELKYYK